jgi:hypothetical protein
MTFSRKTLLAASAIVVGLGLTTACGGSDSPTAPSNPSNPLNPNAPRVLLLSPGTLTMSNNAQTLTVTGERFASGLSILIDAPNGVWMTYSGADISVQSATSFTAKVILDKVGVWDITLHSATGLESNEVQFSVVAP